MKNNIIIITIMFFALVLASCKEEPIGLQPQDSVPPGPVSDVTYKAIPGGAVFRYTLPTDEDLLYVKAVYYRKEGVPSEARATIYTDSLLIEGFGDTQTRDIKLIAVDRSRNESEPFTQPITPLEPDITHIGQSLELKADYGSIRAFWDNPNKKEISVVVLIKDEFDEYIPFETFYSSGSIGNAARYQMDTIQGDFAIYAQDKWQNKSATKYATLTPLFETQLDRLLFATVNLPNDAPNFANGSYPVRNLFDGNMGSIYSSLAGQTPLPHSITIDLGVTAKLSRIRVFQRTGYFFQAGNPRHFEIWGCQGTIDMTGNWDSWTRLMVCESIKPSGLPVTQLNDDDIDRATNGEDFFNSPDNPPVRYIRVNVISTWPFSGDNWQSAELSIYGDNRPNK